MGIKSKNKRTSFTVGWPTMKTSEGYIEMKGNEILHENENENTINKLKKMKWKWKNQFTEREM